MQQKTTFQSYIIYRVILLLVAYVSVAMVITVIIPLMIPHLYGANLNVSQMIISGISPTIFTPKSVQ